MNSKLPAGRFPTNPQSAGVEGGDGGVLKPAALDLLGFDLPNPFRYQQRRWCANCGGEQTFVPVDRFPFGWRGYCLGCEDVVFVMDARTTSEACA
jgi:hypothetical protein